MKEPEPVLHDGKEQQVYHCNSCGYEFVSLPRRHPMICPDCGGHSCKNITEAKT